MAFYEVFRNTDSGKNHLGRLMKNLSKECISLLFLSSIGCFASLVLAILQK
jgi:hypothetical protein